MRCCRTKLSFGHTDEISTTPACVRDDTALCITPAFTTCEHGPCIGGLTEESLSASVNTELLIRTRVSLIGGGLLDKSGRPFMAVTETV